MIGTSPLSASFVLLTFRIATVLILEYASILFASPYRPTRKKAFDKACSKFMSSGTQNAVNQLVQLFLLSPESYSTQKFIEFILAHRLR